MSRRHFREQLQQDGRTPLSIIWCTKRSQHSWRLLLMPMLLLSWCPRSAVGLHRASVAHYQRRSTLFAASSGGDGARAGGRRRQRRGTSSRSPAVDQAPSPATSPASSSPAVASATTTTTTTTTTPSAPSPSPNRTNDGTIFPVPPPLRDPARPEAIARHVQFLALKDLFPEVGARLEELFDGDAAFRQAVRAAAREDMFTPILGLSDEKNAQLKDAGSSLEGNWKECGPCLALTAVFSAHGLEPLDGRTFISRLGSLCVDPPLEGEGRGEVEGEVEVRGGDGEGGSFPVTGSWLDIVSPKGGRRTAAHAWHQDSGLEQWTCMLGFPPSDHYEGPGVFSHAVRLSHAMPPPETPGPVVIEGPPPDPNTGEVRGAFPEAHVERPVFRRGAEVMLYKDCDHVHSAPDEFNREGIWRFM